MNNVNITGWQVGFNKIEFTKLLREDFNFSLSQAKKNTDNLLEGKIIQLSFNENKKNKLINKLNKLEVNYSLVEGN
jgi:hypothetical protein